jgi:hypothetical protein
MARLKNEKGHHLELSPIAYQFTSGDNEYDLNWLEIRMAADNGKVRWTTTDPALLNWEVTRLIAWLRKLADKDGTIKPFWKATEPCLEFESGTGKNAIELKAILGYDFLPPLLSRKNYEDRATIIFDDDGSKIHRFAAELEQELMNFPVREK